MQIADAIVELRHDDATAYVRRALERGDDALHILESCRAGMARVGERFQAGEYFLSELLIAAEIFKSCATLLEPFLATSHRSAGPTGRVVLATMRGDIHDLGKSIVATLLRAHGFEVHDLGVNVDPGTLVEKVRHIEPELVGFSALITPSFHSTKEAVERLRTAGLRERLHVMLGGGVTTAEVRDYVGADFQTTDAASGVTWCLERMRERHARATGAR